ncbi:MAG: helix-turn-helix transcriptional regulator [Clostridia bacterium]|nr:helix-turn-helix transcriptional regulator [Clostridia bacterium]
MKTFTAADFLAADLGITRIERIYHATNVPWERPFTAAREMEGLLFFSKGAICYDFGGFTFEAHAGQVLKLPAGIPYTGVSLGENVHSFHVIDFYIDRPGDFFDFPIPMSFTPSDPEAVHRAFLQIEEQQRSHGLCSRMNVRASLFSLLTRLALDYAESLGYSDRSRIFQITEYIRENAHRRDLRISDIAAHFHISETHLRRLFAAELDISPAAYLTSVRMENARTLLLGPNMTIQEIAEACGYSSIYYFSAAFRESMDCSPSEYRQRNMQTMT